MVLGTGLLGPHLRSDGSTARKLHRHQADALNAGMSGPGCGQTSSTSRLWAADRHHNSRSCQNGSTWPDSEVAERPADFRFLGCSGLVVLAGSLSESAPSL